MSDHNTTIFQNSSNLDKMSNNNYTLSPSNTNMALLPGQSNVLESNPKSLFSLTPSPLGPSNQLFSLSKDLFSPSNTFNSPFPASDDERTRGTEKNAGTTFSNFSTPAFCTPPSQTKDYLKEVPERPSSSRSLPVSERGNMMTPSIFPTQTDNSIACNSPFSSPTFSSLQNSEIFSQIQKLSGSANLSANSNSVPNQKDSSSNKITSLPVARILAFDDNNPTNNANFDRVQNHTEASTDRTSSLDKFAPNAKRPKIYDTFGPQSHEFRADYPMLNNQKNINGSTTKDDASSIKDGGFSATPFKASIGKILNEMQGESQFSSPDQRFSNPNNAQISSSPTNFAAMKNNNSFDLNQLVPNAPGGLITNNNINYQSNQNINFAMQHSNSPSAVFAVPNKPVSAQLIQSSTSFQAKANFSNYNAALAAQSLLEDAPEDLYSVDDSREQFVLESGKLASTIEAYVENIREDAERLAELNLNLQLANNELLLQNAALEADTRMKRAEEYFLKCIMEE